MATVTLLDDRTRPKAPALAGATEAHKMPGRHLKMIHRYHLQQMAQVRRVLDLVDEGTAKPDALRDAVGNLDLKESMRMFGNICGQECEMLTAHHDIESAYLFPVLHQRGNEGIRKVVDRLVAEHEIIHHYLLELENGVAKLMTAQNAEKFSAIKDTFLALEGIIKSHFNYEETELETAIGFYGVEI